jgi:hypothetical protein
MSDDDYKQDLEIDFFNLHLNYRDQASNFMKWSEKWVNSVRERDKRKRFLRINIRKNPDQYDLPAKPSVAAANAAMDEDEELIRLTYEVNLYQSAKDAFNQRRYALDGLIKLYLNGYFAGPHPATLNVKEEVKAERERKVHATQHDKLQQSTRIKRRDHGDKQTSTETKKTEG